MVLVSRLNCDCANVDWARKQYQEGVAIVHPSGRLETRVSVTIHGHLGAMLAS